MFLTVVFQASPQGGGNAKKEEQILAWCEIVVKFYSSVTCRWDVLDDF